jgi:hypothetical protein
MDLTASTRRYHTLSYETPHFLTAEIAEIAEKSRHGIAFVSALSAISAVRSVFPFRPEKGDGRSDKRHAADGDQGRGERADLIDEVANGRMQDGNDDPGDGATKADT